MDGERLKRAREAHGLTQKELARRLRVGERTIGNWESGATVPKSRMGMLAEVFGDDLEDRGSDPIRDAPETVLLAELLRRAAARQAATG